MRLREARVRAGIETQAEAARLLGISCVNYSRYESNRRKMSISLIPIVARTFGCSTDWLLGTESETLPQREVTSDAKTESDSG
jgi:transcriptional regulator with XRE-family HTH domain